MKGTPWRDWPTGRRIALGALVASLLLDLAVVLCVGQVDARPPVVPLSIGRVASVAPRAPDDPAAIQAAAARNPFGESTAASAGAPGPVIQQTMSLDPERPRLVGTVVEAEGRSFVVVELPDSRMQVVRIGERVGTLLLRSVTEGAAVFVGAHGERVSLRSPQAGTGPRE